VAQRSIGFLGRPAPRRRGAASHAAARRLWRGAIRAPSRGWRR